jgi:hypothetical protein
MPPLPVIAGAGGRTGPRGAAEPHHDGRAAPNGEPPRDRTGHHSRAASRNGATSGNGATSENPGTSENRAASPTGTVSGTGTASERVIPKQRGTTQNGTAQKDTTHSGAPQKGAGQDGTAQDGTASAQRTGRRSPGATDAPAVNRHGGRGSGTYSAAGSTRPAGTGGEGGGDRVARIGEDRHESAAPAPRGGKPVSELTRASDGTSGAPATGGGLPAYTMPPAGPGAAAPAASASDPQRNATAASPADPQRNVPAARPADPPPSAPVSGQPRIYQSTGAWPTVTSTVAPEPAAMPAPPKPGGAVYGGVPLQRGTVYGAAGRPADLTMAVPTQAPTENTGSLTGHILNQGWSDINQHTSRNNRKVVIIMAVVLVSLVAISLLVVLTANNLIATLFGGLSKGLG